VSAQCIELFLPGYCPAHFNQRTQKRPAFYPGQKPGVASLLQMENHLFKIVRFVGGSSQPFFAPNIFRKLHVRFCTRSLDHRHQGFNPAPSYPGRQPAPFCTHVSRRNIPAFLRPSHQRSHFPILGRSLGPDLNRISLTPKLG
jgi:hypothetical protein